MTDSYDFQMDDEAPTPRMNGRIPENALPSNVASEKMILGSILLDNKQFVEADEKIEPEDFSLDSHQRIYQRMRNLFSAGHNVDLVTLANELSRFKEVESVGGIAYIGSLLEGLPRRPMIADHLRIVKDKALARRLISICESTIARAIDQADTALEVGLAHSAQVQDAVTTGLPSTLERAGDFLNRTFPSARDMTEIVARDKGVMTGFEEVDEMTCGLQKGELIIIGARPSQGKTALMGKIAEHAGIDCSLKVAIFSLEQSTEALMRRMICSRARVPYYALKSGTMTEAMKDEYEAVYEELCNSDIFIDEETNKPASKIAAQCRAMKSKQGLDLALIDYLGLMGHPENKRGRSKHEEVGMDALILKNVAKELGIPVVVLAQLSRESTKRVDKRPTLPDLRDSGSLEEHADVVAFIHREGYYDKTDDDLKNKAEIIIAKQRQGATGTCHVGWDGTIFRFSDVIDPKKFKKREGDWWNA